MTAELKSLIEQIEMKAQNIHQKLVNERLRVSSMNEDINRLNAIISELIEKNTLQENEINQLNEALKLKNEQVTTPISSSSMNHLDIDVLVREIDFCMQQVKTTNE